MDPGISDLKSYRKNFFKSFLPSPFVVAFVGGILWFVHEEDYALFMWVFSLIQSLIILAPFAWPKHIRTIAAVMLYFHVIFAFITVLSFGGILQSGGVVLVGLAGALFSTSMLSGLHTKRLFFLFMFTLVLEPFLQPIIPVQFSLGARANHFLFIAHILVITFALYVSITHYIGLIVQAREREAKRLCELDALKTRFYTNITHEFRTPLTVILGMADQILAFPSVFAKKGAQMIRESGHWLLQLVNQMLDLSKLESGEARVYNVQGDIIPFIQYLIEPFQWLAERRNVRISCQFSDASIQMDFDPEKLGSLMSNLLSNALKYAPDGSIIEVRVTQMDHLPDPVHGTYHLFPTCGDGEDRAFLRIAIQDFGRGITQEAMPQIFDRYVRDEAAGNDYSAGTGIGLALVRELVALMEGNLSLSSKIGEGSIFTVTLPIRNQAVESHLSLAEHPPAPDHGKLRTEQFPDREQTPEGKHIILIIEDNQNVSQYLSFILNRKYTVEIAGDGDQGVEKACKIVPDLIITDVMMPGKDGFEVCAILKQDFRTSHIPIIMLTARADQPSKMEGLNCGADDYLVKPFYRDELITRINNLLLLREKLRQKYLITYDGLDQGNIKSHDAMFFKDLKEVLKQNLDNADLDTQRLAEQLNMSRTQLFRKLKALTGHSASQVIRKYRLEHAKYLLKTSRLNISEVGYSVGFRDPAYFSKAFSRAYGKAPSEYRQTAHSQA